MNTLDRFFDEVEARVQEQQEQDEWEALANEQFSWLCEQLFLRVQTLLEPLVGRLTKYSMESVKKVWSVEQDPTKLKIQFRDRELEFRPMGQEAKQPGDRYTVRLLRKNEDLIGRFVLFFPPGSPTLQLGVLGHGTVTERLDDQHFVELLVNELFEG